MACPPPPSLAVARLVVTVGTVIRELLPFGANPLDLAKPDPNADWNIVPLWPPDLFAVVATLAERSGFYAEPGVALSTSPADRQAKRERAEAAEKLGEKWGRDKRGDPPAEVFELWGILRDCWDMPVASGPRNGRCWKEAAMHLLAIADEACAGVGFLPLRDGPSPRIVAFVYEEYVVAASDPPARGRSAPWLPHLPYSLARAVPADRASVLPKALTPEVGCTLRSTSHNLALLPGLGQVSAEWRMVNWSNRTAGGAGDAPEIAPFNLLVIPFPYVLNAGAFRCTRQPDGPDVDGYFEVKPSWLPQGALREQAHKVVQFISALIVAAEADGGDVNAVILPETALPASIALRVAEAVAKRHPHIEMVIAGIIETAPARPEGPYPHNAAFVARFGGGKKVDQYQQAKHHRWRIDPAQVEQYQLAHVLDSSRSWWEMIDLADRSMVFGLDARQAVVAALICEDLARYDPVLPVLASIGPNLVIALLLDGPQLRGRWSSRHAAVLAADPGSAVLTVTSLGMVRRSKTPPGVQARDCVALWTERGKAPRELDLATGAHALLLSLSAQQRRQKTLDLRRQRDSGGLVEYRLGGCRSVTLPRREVVRNGWLFNPVSEDHSAEVREGGVQ